MERRGSGMKKIIDSYKPYECLTNYRAPAFTSNASEFHVTLYNLNYNTDVINGVSKTEEFIKDEQKFAKEFVKASRQIYGLISQNSQISAAQMAENMGLSVRQVQKYLKRLQDLQKIIRVGSRKSGEWKIIDDEHERI